MDVEFTHGGHETRQSAMYSYVCCNNNCPRYQLPKIPGGEMTGFQAKLGDLEVLKGEEREAAYKRKYEKYEKKQW